VNRPIGPNSELPLAVAIENERVQLARRLVAPPISADVNLYSGDEMGFPPLHWAVDVGSLELVELLLAAGADPTATTFSGEEFSVLHLAQHADVLRRLLQLGLPLKCRDSRGLTPLLLACNNSDVECVEVLLAAGADIHATDNRGWGVLHRIALRKPSGELMQLLLDHATDHGRPLNVNAPDKDGTTPLMTAARWIAPVLVEALLGAGEDVTAVDSQGWTALHHIGRPAVVDEIAESAFKQVYQLQISAGGDAYALDNSTNTPLQLAFY